MLLPQKNAELSPDAQASWQGLSSGQTVFTVGWEYFWLPFTFLGCAKPEDFFPLGFHCVLGTVLRVSHASSIYLPL